MAHTAVSQSEFNELEGFDDWRVVFGAIQAEFAAGSYAGAARLIAAIADAAEEAGHHPDVDLRYPDRARVTLMTHATGGLTSRDVDLARRISALAAEAEAVSSPGQAHAIELAIDTIDADRIRPFWAAVLGYQEAGGCLVDPARTGPSVWFQQMDEPRTERNRFHIDVAVPHDLADERVAATLAAGGRLVSDSRARAFWILADPDGNEACVCTWQDREF